jgi:hypothetical protein
MALELCESEEDRDALLADMTDEDPMAQADRAFAQMGLDSSGMPVPR